MNPSTDALFTSRLRMAYTYLEVGVFGLLLSVVLGFSGSWSTPLPIVVGVVAVAAILYSKSQFKVAYETLEETTKNYEDLKSGTTPTGKPAS